MDRYATHAYGLFPNLAHGDFGGTQEFLKWLRGKFWMTDFDHIGDEGILAHLVYYPVNPYTGYAPEGLLEHWGGHNVPPIDAMTLGLSVTEKGAYIEKCKWPDDVLKEWANRGHPQERTK